MMRKLDEMTLDVLSVIFLQPVCGELLILANGRTKCRFAHVRETVRVPFRMMRLLFALLGHLLVTPARLAGRGGVRSVVAESLAVKHQLLIMQRSQPRAPNLTSWDRLLLGFYTLWVSSKRVRKMAVRYPRFRR